jgi:alkylation response protein AidB-like acyl-CoA dehydrogenase
VPAEHLIGIEGTAFDGIAMTFNDERLGLAASATSFAEVAYEEALAHAKLRRTFGKPLIQHQVIRHKLVDMRQRTAASQAFLDSSPGRWIRISIRSRTSACSRTRRPRRWRSVRRRRCRSSAGPVSCAA